MEISEAVMLAMVPPKAHRVAFEGSTYEILLPAHFTTDADYYLTLFTRRMEMGLISGDSGIIAGAYEWRKVPA